MTHSDLVRLAARWLSRKCSVVLTELVTSGETADAIGWHGWASIVVECKVSRNDFRADAQKFFRRVPSEGMGQHRYFLVPSGLISLTELPEKWGLLEVTGDAVRVTRKSEIFSDTNDRHELGVLLSCLRRIGQTAPPGISIKCYTIQTENTATLGVEPLELSEKFPALPDIQPITTKLAEV